MIDKIKNAIKRYILSQPKLIKYYNFTYKRQDHNIDLILTECIKRVKNGNTYKSSIYLPSSTFNDAYQKLHKRKILKNTYIELLKLYFEKGPNRKLLYRHRDTTFIVNKNGHNKVEYNGYKKRKRTKVDIETDSNGVVIFSNTNSGNMNDAKIFNLNKDKYYFIDEDLRERLSKYYCADPGYHTKDILNYIRSIDLIPIIKANIKNTKDKDKLKKLKLNKHDTKIYNKRFIIEDTNGNIKSFKLVQTRMDANSENFAYEVAYRFANMESSLFISYINKVLKYI
jgi:hypothetical protein